MRGGSRLLQLVQGFRQPFRMVEVPVDGIGEPCGERPLRPPAQRTFQLRTIDGVAPVVAGTIRHRLEQPRVRRLGWPTDVEQGAELVDEIEIAHLGAAADAVGLARFAPFEDDAQRAGVIVDMQPVADVAAVAVDRQRLATQRVVNDPGDQLLRQLPRAVVVRAVWVVSTGRP